MDSSDKYAHAREEMVRRQIEARGIEDPVVLRAMRTVPRERFVPLAWKASAYEDHPLPIEAEQTISQPFVVAAMTAALGLRPDSRVLEIGTGSGYQCAILAAIAQEVHSIEFFAELHLRAQALCKDLGLANVHLHYGDGSAGWVESAPYDAIIATCAAPKLPPEWTEQLAPGGRLVAPIGSDGMQRLLRFRRIDDELEEEFLMNVRFVPLLNRD